MNKYFEKIQAIKRDVEDTTSIESIDAPIEKLVECLPKALDEERSSKYIKQIKALSFHSPMYVSDNMLANAKSNRASFLMDKDSLLEIIDAVLKEMEAEDQKCCSWLKRIFRCSWFTKCNNLK